MPKITTIKRAIEQIKHGILTVIGLSIIILIAFLLEHVLGLAGIATTIIALCSLIFSLLVYFYGPRVKGPQLEITDAWFKVQFRVDENNTRVDKDIREFEGRAVVHIFIQNMGDKVGYFRVDDAKIITKDKIFYRESNRPWIWKFAQASYYEEKALVFVIPKGASYLNNGILEVKGHHSIRYKGLTAFKQKIKIRSLD